jgi:hypothetical protein
MDTLMKRTSRESGQVLAEVYDDNFYKGQVDSSLKAGIKYAKLLAEHYQPKSVIDVGCGRGTWLKAFKSLGADKVVGIDGSCNNQQNMIDQSIIFYETDLNLPIDENRFDRFDLAMSLEVAEHLEPASAAQFVTSLTGLSNAVLFAAAYSKQGGTNHINEQPHSYWAQLFKSRAYEPFDLFRATVWGDADIPFWYQQNAFLYVRTGSVLYESLKGKGFHPLANLSFLNCVHPDLYDRYSNPAPISKVILVKQLVRKLIPKPLLPIALRLKKRYF